MVEYGLLVALIAMVALVGVKTARNQPQRALHQRRGLALTAKSRLRGARLGGDCASQPYPIHSNRLQKVMSCTRYLVDSRRLFAASYYDVRTRRIPNALTGFARPRRAVIVHAFAAGDRWAVSPGRHGRVDARRNTGLLARRHRRRRHQARNRGFGHAELSALRAVFALHGDLGGGVLAIVFLLARASGRATPLARGLYDAGRLRQA